MCNYFDIIIFTETWLNSGVHDNELFDDRYTVFRRDRESSGFHNKKEGGGVLIAISKHLKSYRLHLNESDCEDLWVKIEMYDKSGNSKNLYICSVYIPPPIQQTLLNHFIINTNRILSNHSGDTIILGDFNLSSLIWNKTSTLALAAETSNSILNNMFIDFMSLNNLSQYNCNYNNKNRILDLLLSNKSISQLQVAANPLTLTDPLHPPLQFYFKSEFTEVLPVKHKEKFLFYQADYQKIINDLNQISWTNELSACTTVDDMVTKFYHLLKLAIVKYVPKVRPRTNSRKYPFWFSNSLIKILNEKHKYRIKFRKYGNSRDLLTYELLRERSIKLLKSNYKTYLDRLELSLSSNPKLIWSFLKRKRGGSTTYPAKMSLDDNVASTGPGICDLFASQFSSSYNKAVTAGTVSIQPHMTSATNFLTMFSVNVDQVYRVLKRLDATKGAGYDGLPSVFVVRCASALAKPLSMIFNCSLRSGSYPTAWKTALIVPLYKSGDASSVKNYRPISLLPVFAKVFEKVLYPVLSWHIKQQISPEQHGFIKTRSTTTNLTSFVEDLAEGVDKGHSIDVIYTDFSKAFDRVSHIMLLDKLAALGIANVFLKWWCSYLIDRKSVVVIGGHNSEPFTAHSGVPQGSHFGPLLFNIFINDIGSCFQNTKFYMFADDLKFFRRVDTDEDRILLQNDLNNLALWCTLNTISLNTSKCCKIRFTRKKIESPTTTYYINNEPLYETDHVRDLGVVLDNKLRFNLHIDHIVKKGFKALGFVLRNCRDFKKPATKIKIYTALVRSGLEYCSVVWNPHYDIYKKRLESIQKRFLWHLSYSCNLAKSLPSYEDRLRHFCLKSLENRRKQLDYMFLYKLINGYTDASHLLSQINIAVPRRMPRSLKYKPFFAKPARSNLGHHSPLNRMLRSYNDIHNLSLETSLLNNVRFKNLSKMSDKYAIDIFSNTLHAFKFYISLSQCH